MVKKFSKQVAALLMAALMIPVFYAFPAKAYDNKIYYQTASEWKSHRYYYNGWNDSNSFKESACGIFAFVNAVSFLNGSYIDPDVLATYATNNNFHGSGGTSHGLYKSFCDNRGSQYGIAFEGAYPWSYSVYETLRNKLQNGCTAISYTSTHLLAIVAYNASNNTYKVVDSAPSEKRGTSNGYAWKTERELRNLLYSGGPTFYVIRSTYPVINGEFFLQTTVTNQETKVLDIYYGRDSEKYAKNVQICGFNGGDNQKFRITYMGNGWHRIQALQPSLKSLDVEGNYSVSGTNVIVWGNHDGDNQCWRFIPDGNGFRIQSKLGFYLDVYGGFSSDETNVQIWEGNGGSAQRWKLYKTSDGKLYTA